MTILPGAMTADAATAPPRKRRLWLIGLAVVVAAVTIALRSTVFVDDRPTVSVTVSGYVTNRVSFLLAGKPTNRTLVWPRIAITNNSARTITVKAKSPTEDPIYCIATNAGGVWRITYWSWPPFPEPFPVRRLLPGEGVCFIAMTSFDGPYRVALIYDNGSTPSRLWRKVPNWIAQRVPWSHSSRTNMSEIIKSPVLSTETKE